MVTLIILIVVRTDTSFNNTMTDTKAQKYMQNKKFDI